VLTRKYGETHYQVCRFQTPNGAKLTDAGAEQEAPEDAASCKKYLAARFRLFENRAVRTG
jgi:hypothetical protein